MVSSPTDGPLDGRPPCTTEIACSLDAESMPERLDEWLALLAHAIDRRRTTTGALRVQFDEHIDVATLARVVRAEQECCAFFSFAITIDQRGPALEVSAPGEAGEIVRALFGDPA